MTGERKVAAELLARARDTGALGDQVIALADKGLTGREMERYAADQVKVLLARPDGKDKPHRFGSLGGMRQWIESVNDTLKGQLDLERHGGRAPAGVFARIAQRLLAMAAAIWHNWAIGASLRSLTAYDHRNHKESLIQGLVATGIRLCGEWPRMPAFRLPRRLRARIAASSNRASPLAAAADGRWSR